MRITRKMKKRKSIKRAGEVYAAKHYRKMIRAKLKDQEAQLRAQKERLQRPVEVDFGSILPPSIEHIREVNNSKSWK